MVSEKGIFLTINDRLKEIGQEIKEMNETIHRLRDDTVKEKMKDKEEMTIMRQENSDQISKIRIDMAILRNDLAWQMRIYAIISGAGASVLTAIILKLLGLT